MMKNKKQAEEWFEEERAKLQQRTEAFIHNSRTGRVDIKEGEANLEDCKRLLKKAMKNKGFSRMERLVHRREFCIVMIIEFLLDLWHEIECELLDFGYWLFGGSKEK